MKKTFKTVIALVLAAALGLFTVAETVLLLPEQFDHLFLGELTDKYQRLRSFDGENKIVVIGGSSVAFGVRSPMLEEYLGMPVVNFGLYGPLGTDVMMDLTRGHIREGDVVVLAPETDPQTMSMYFNAEGMWQACDSDLTMLLKIRPHDWGQMLGIFWQFAQRKLTFYRYGKPQPGGVYDHASFDEYGDVIYDREAHATEDWYDTEVLVDLDPAIIEPEFIDYVNEYVDYCESRGARVFWSWPPMNRLAVQQDEAGILSYATYVREHIHCQIISDITDYIMDPGYFYDTNYHVTGPGAIVHSARLIQDLNNFIGGGTPVDIDLPAPGAPSKEPSAEPPAEEAAAPEDAAPAVTPIPAPEETGSSADAACFTYDDYEGRGLILTGVTAEGMDRESLEVPWEIGGEKVLAVDTGFLAGCENLRTLYIQANLERVMQGAFDSCPRLTELRVDGDGSDLLVPGTGLFDNVSPRLRVYVPEERYGSFVADYFWGNYIDRIVKE